MCGRVKKNGRSDPLQSYTAPQSTVAYQSPAPSAARANSYAEYKTKINYRVSDCFVGCSARALSLIVPPWPLSVGTTHSTIGLFRRLNWATSPRSGGRCAQLHAGPASATLAGRAEVRVLLVTDGLWAVVPVLRGQAPRTRRRGRSLAYALRGRKLPPAGRRRQCASISTR